MNRFQTNFLYWGLGLLLLAGATGCRHTEEPPRFRSSQAGAGPEMTTVQLTNKVDPAWLQPPTNRFTLGPGDKLDLELLGEPGPRTTTVVAPDGKLYFSLVPGVDVWGLTLEEARKQLENGLAEYMRERPQVSLTLRGVESQRVWVLGRVQAPGVYSMAAPVTLLEAISLAGGTLSLVNYRDQEAAGISEELADLRRSFVIREGQLLPIDFERLLKQGDLAQNIYLQPDDFIYLAPTTAREVHVLGAVVQPRPVPYREGLTVAAAVASAYGTLNGAYLSHVVVIRGALSHPEVAVVDYRNVIRGQAMDVALEPRDIVYVPFSPFRYLYRYIEIALNTFVSSAAINAGSKAVVDQPTAGAGIFIPVGSGIKVIPPVTPPPIR